jgi:Nif-specific regulatory protein
VFAGQVAVVADRLLSRHRRQGPADATAEIRKHFRCDGIAGRSEALARVLREAAQVAPLPISVLITGPNGTGKSALARAIASNSPRAAGPYIDLNCAAVPDTLLEVDLFGAETVGYTSGRMRLPGKVAAARGGTLLLDEIGELSPGAQAKLLQLLQEQRYYPVGAASSVTADVRIISATNADLKALVAQKKFREDLYYRLAVMTIAMPSLDERREDIPELVERFCAEACQRNQLPVLRPTRRALFACREMSWPGNVRELANAIEAAVARASFERATAVDEHHIFPAAPRRAEHPTFREATQRFQRRILEEALTRNEWNIRRTATELDLSRQYVHDLISTFGLRQPEEE